MTRRQPTTLVALVATALTLLAGSAGAAAVFQIQNADGAGEGFNDPTPWTPTGGNPATTVGAARLNAFEFAAGIWGARLTSGVVIRVEARMDALTCNATSAVLGYAGATTIHADFNGAPRPGTLYPQAMANALAGVDLSPARPDLSATFNSAINGSAGCLGGASWYYGYDGNPPRGDVDFVTVVLHELGHGLGFQTFMDIETGEKLGGYDDMYMVNLERAGASPADFPSMSNAQRAAACIADPELRWTDGHVTYMQAQIPLIGGLNGGYVRLHAPDPIRPGSSVSHWSTSLLPNELMEPSLTGVIHDPGLATFLMMDMGWPMDAGVGVAFTALSAVPRGDAVEISWRFTADEPVAGFVIERQRAGATAATLLNGGALLPVTTASHVDADVVPGASYRYVVSAVRPDGSRVPSPEVTVTLDDALTDLAQNHPNPFNAATEVGYSLNRSAHVRLRVHDLAGRLVRTLVDDRRPAGAHVAFWDGRDDQGRALASGTYVYRLETGTTSRVRRMVLLK